MNLKYYLKKAEKENWAMGQFNFSNLIMLEAIIRAGKNLKSPLVVGTSEGDSRFVGLVQAAALAESYKQETRLPIFLHLDHGKSLAYIKEAIKAGYDSVHFDGSELPLKKNIEITKKVVAFARKRNILVEGEVGVIGGKLANAEEVEKFARETNVDILAVNIGTFHGIKSPKGNPHINLQRLREIKAKIGSLPLVMHGGSGTPREDIKKALKLGVAKVIISTEIRMAYSNTLRRVLKAKPKEIVPYKFLTEVIDEIEKVVEGKMKLFGSANKI